jgi:hypothetical protein
MTSLDRIIQTLIINGTLTEPSGLFHGKTGIAVFFFNYARQTNNKLFHDYAIDLIEEIQQQITVTVSARYDIGLAGIGVGFEYFLQNGFLEAEDDNIFEEFDARMYRAAMYEPYPDLSLGGGLTGWGRYFIYRLRGSGHKGNKLHEALVHVTDEITQKIEQNTVPENEQPDVYRFFCDLTTLPEYTNQHHYSLQQCKEWECISKPNVQSLFPYLGNLQRLHVCQNYFNIDLSEKIGQEWKKWEEMNNNFQRDMGMLKGWASEGLLYLTSVHPHDISWFNLL